MSRASHFILCLFLLIPSLSHAAEEVGATDAQGRLLTATHQWLHPAGDSVEFNGRPVDIALHPNGKWLYAKDNRGFVVVDAVTWKVIQELAFGEKFGSSMHGITLDAAGKRLYATSAQDKLFVAEIADNGELKLLDPVPLPGPQKTDESHGTGIALSKDAATAYVCLSRNNALVVVDLNARMITKTIDCGVAPFDVVLSPDAKLAYVSNWGGRHPKAGDETADSSGTPVVVDKRGIASTGSVSIINLETGETLHEIETGLHPSDLVLSADGLWLFVAEANSDTLSIINTAEAKIAESLSMHLDPQLPFGSMPNACALTPDEATLFVALGGNNAVAQVDVSAYTKGQAAPQAKIQGYIPTEWYPGAVIAAQGQLYVANIKGRGSRFLEERNKKGWNSHWHMGTLGKVALPDAATLANYSKQVHDNGNVPAILRAQEKSPIDVPPTPVPAQWGAPSPIKHIVYIIKENRTYDQMFGDLNKGNGDRKLCVYPRNLSPNHHAIAEQFVLLDNFYCNGVLSADGHSWVTEGNVTDHLEKAFGGFTRSYTCGDDPITYSSSGFIWDRVLAAGLSFRNYGEMTQNQITPANASFTDIYNNWKNKTNNVTFAHNILIKNIATYTCMNYPGWGMNIPDQVRADAFLKEFEQQKASGLFPNLTMIYLPNDHTSGTKEDMPTPRAHMADNDLALGRVVDAISHSQFWPETCIISVEDDPQDGFDHVDGHRSICLVASPYIKRGAVVSNFYNQTSVLHTIERILGVPPMNQMDSQAPTMEACFQETPDLTPYTVLPVESALDELNAKKADLRGDALRFAKLSEAQNFAEQDRADEDSLNRILWFALKGPDAKYPAEWAGAHGKGLKGLKLTLDPEAKEEEEE